MSFYRWTFLPLSYHIYSRLYSFQCHSKKNFIYPKKKIHADVLFTYIAKWLLQKNICFQKNGNCYYQSARERERLSRRIQEQNEISGDMKVARPKAVVKLSRLRKINSIDGRAWQSKFSRQFQNTVHRGTRIKKNPNLFVFYTEKKTQTRGWKLHTYFEWMPSVCKIVNLKKHIQHTIVIDEENKKKNL